MTSSHRYTGLVDECRLTLRPNDFDRYDLLNNAVYLEIFEHGRWSWSLANGCSPDQTDIAAVVIELNARYLHPVAWRPLLQVGVRTEILTIEPYSIRLGQSILLEEATVATGVIRLATLDRHTRVPVRAERMFAETPNDNAR